MFTFFIILLIIYAIVLSVLMMASDKDNTTKPIMEKNNQQIMEKETISITKDRVLELYKESCKSIQKYDYMHPENLTRGDLVEMNRAVGRCQALLMLFKDNKEIFQDEDLLGSITIPQNRHIIEVECCEHDGQFTIGAGIPIFGAVVVTTKKGQSLSEGIKLFKEAFTFQLEEMRKAKEELPDFITERNYYFKFVVKE